MRSFIREGMKAANKRLSHMLHLLALEQAIADYPSSLTDEQLKQEDRKTMTDVYRQLDQLLHCAKVRARARARARVRVGV